MAQNAKWSHQLPEIAIHLRGLSKSYGRTVALRELSLDVSWARVLAVFGHNGAGKSTLLRVLATIVAPSEGTVHVAGHERNVAADRIRESIGYVGHQNLLYDSLTPSENLLFYARLYGVPNADVRVAQVLADIRATQWATRRTGTLSNGMQKRIAIGRALLHRPSILLLDEPFAGLDIEGQGLLNLIIRAVAQGGATVVLATHDIEQGLSAADDYVVLRQGSFAETGSTDEARVSQIVGLMEPLAHRGGTR